MAKIILHDNSLNIRGTTVAIYDYGYYLKRMGYDVRIMYNGNDSATDELVISKFRTEFGDVLYKYNDYNNMQDLINEISPDYFFAIKSGYYDNVISSNKNVKNLIMAVGVSRDIHGDRYYYCSKWLSMVCGGDYVPHMINLPNVVGDYRSDFNIPNDAIVITRTGGHGTFDLDFVKSAIIDTIHKRNDVYYIMQNVDRFIEHDRVIYIDKMVSLEDKVKLINTSDYLLHARNQGESFGITIGEYNIKNKGIISYVHSPEKNHNLILGNNAIWYGTYADMCYILENIDKREYPNMYSEYMPDVVMDRFKNKYLL